MADKVLLTESARIRIEAEHDGSDVTIRFGGRIDEDVDLGVVLEYFETTGKRAGGVRLDMGQLREINSCGVRSWILFIEKLQTMKPCEFAMANEVFMDQVNMVQNMLGRPRLPVRAFEAPYFCAKCNKRTLRIVRPADIVRDPDGSFRAPGVRCEVCAGSMAFDS